MTGNFSPEREGQAAALFRDIVQEEGMGVKNTFQGGEATFASTRGILTRNDCSAASADCDRVECLSELGWGCGPSEAHRSMTFPL